MNSVNSRSAALLTILGVSSCTWPQASKPTHSVRSAFKPQPTAITLAKSAWPKRHHDLRNTSRSPLAGPAKGKVIWRTLISPNHGSHVDSSPVVDSLGNIYVGSQDRNLYSLSPEGRIRWRLLTDQWILRSSPLISSAGIVYQPSEDGYLHAVNTQRALQWRWNLGLGSPDTSPSVGTDGAILIGNDRRDGLPVDTEESTLFALSGDGRPKWSRRVEGRQYACPAVGTDGRIYITSTRVLSCFDAKGAPLWTAPVASWESPVIMDGGNLLVAAEHEGPLVSLRPDGSAAWKVGMKSSTTPALASDGTIYVGRDDGLRAVTPTGHVKWHRCRGLIATGHALSVDKYDNVYAGFSRGWVYSLDKNGRTRWRLKLNMEATGSPPVIGAPGRIYLGGMDKYLYAIE